MKRNFKVGDKVQSNFRARWYGIITEIIPYHNKVGYVCLCVPMLTRSGDVQKKKYIKRLSPYWLSLTEFDDKYIKKNWI